MATDVTLLNKYRNPDYFEEKNAPEYIYAGGGSLGDLSNYYTKADLNGGQLDNRYYTETEVDTLLSGYYTKTALDGGQLDNRYYTETEIGTLFYTKTALDGGQLDNRYYTETELNNGQLDTRYYTETEIDNSVVKIAGTQTITGAKTFSATITAPSGSWSSTSLEASGYIRSAGRLIAGGLSNIHASAQYQGKIDTTLSYQNFLLFRDESATVQFSIDNGSGAGGYFPVFTGKVTSQLPGLYFNGNAVNGVPSGTAIVAFDGRVNNGAAAASDIIVGLASGYGSYKVKFYGDGTTIWNDGSELGSSTYSTGYAGSGWRLDYASSLYSLEVDNLVVRNKLSAYELEINKVSAIGGSLVISPASGRSISSSDQGGGSWRIYFDEDGTNNQIGFLTGDIVKAQRYTGGAGSFLGTVTGVTHSATYGSAYITVTVSSGTPWDVMDVVQVGHTSTAARQNLIYITSYDTNNPYIDILSGVTDGDFSGHQKVRLGNLSGITDADFGSLSGYGLYSDNIYLKGAIKATSGKIGSWNINSTSIYTGPEDHSGYTGSAGALTIYSSGSAASIHAYNFYVDASGNIVARAGKIGGFTLDANSLYAGTLGDSGWCTIDGSTGMFGYTSLKTYCFSHQNSAYYLTSPIFHVVAADVGTQSTLYLPSSGLPGSGSSTSIAIIHAYGTGLGAGKYHVNGNGYYINRNGVHSTSTDLDEGDAMLLYWDPRQGGQWYAIGGGGGSMTYPGAGIPLSTGSAWGTSYSVSASGDRWGVIAPIGTDGVMEVGKYLDFHNSDADTGDYANRLTSNTGDISASGTLTASNFILSSDRISKKEIRDLDPENLEIRYRTFRFKKGDQGIRYGVIAQEVEEKYPELVKVADDGLKTVKYIDLLIREIANLKRRIEILETRS